MTPVLRLDKKIMSSRWHRTVSVRLHPADRPCRSITPRSGSRSVRWNPKSDLFNKAAPNHHSKIFRHGTSAMKPIQLLLLSW